jgi:UDP-N-acetylmuramyl tripeptide synthase
MATQISNKKQIDNWMEEMIYIEEHLYKISLPNHKYSISCLSCSWEISYYEASKYLIVDNNNDISCPNCKEGRIRLKSQISKRF